MLPNTLIDPLLLSNFVHQIINPLNGVIGTLDNLIDGTIRDAGRRQQRLETLRAQLTQSIEMIRNLAYLSQVVPTGSEKAPLAQKGQDVSIPAVAIQAAQFFQEAASQRQVKINVTDPITQYLVTGHEDLLRQVFINIFDNGVKYSDSDSEILVTSHPQKKTGHLIVEIQSKGVKFDQSEREKVFELGYRGEAARAIRASGTGLGLFICRRILELAHAATIEAEVSPAAGTTVFRLRFPTFAIGEPHVKARSR